MFRTIGIVAFAITFLGICFHCAIFRPKLNDLFGRERRWQILDGLRVLVFLLTLLFVEQKLTLVGVLRKLVYLVALLCFGILAVTGFYPSLVYGKHLSGYLLMLHATAAPVFAICLAVLAVMWAHNCQFDKNYWPWLQKILQRQALGKAPVEKYELVRKVFFWLIIFLALPVILSMVLSMFPIFGTDGQEFLLQLHRYCTLTLALVAIVHTYLMVMAEASK